MKSLQVVTTRRPFFEEQVRALERHGVTNEIVALPGNPGERSPLEYLQAYPRVLKRGFGEFDVVHASYGVITPLALLQPSRPVVLTLWGSDLMGKYGDMSQRFACYCDEVIVMSEEMERLLSCDAHVVPHGVDLKRFSPASKTDACRQIGWKTDEKHILFPYDPERQVKNFPLAEKTVDRVRDVIEEPVNLQVLYGIDHEEVPLYMNAADVMLLTSNREGSPNTVKEAMACNLPVIATDVGDIWDLLENVSPSAACETNDELAQNLVETLRAEERSDGRNTIREMGLTLTQMGKEIKRVYEYALE
ncbi:glycosyltransferase family 4 protein [Halostagnicola sp. A-GB9-2]|uniref:glycosyltransferase family 4 protein n=1 Tax=Halostagnicola sp. A-GB9-2 TaxID=3048066 RepID=UPI0024C0BF4C|nr:glycosyltransferase family 4 protein [Halostagnicola sp. A-GB9-2]MDJ1434185.1 glycosyltransferase family 4 protein [Halostagnicola sp. A-GB9-2]